MKQQTIQRQERKSNLPIYWKLVEWDKVENNLKWEHEKLPYHNCEIIPMSWCGGYWDNKKIEEGYKFRVDFHSRQHTTKYFYSLRATKKYCYKWLAKVNEWNNINE